MSHVASVAVEPPADHASTASREAPSPPADEPIHFFSLSLDLFSVTGRDGYFRQVNPAFTQAFGHADADLLEQPFISFVHPDDRAATAAALDGLYHGEPALGFEHRFRCRDGTYRWLAWTAVPTPEGLVYAVARDVTERRRAEADRARSAAQVQSAALSDKDAFVLSASHDIGQPLTVIKGQTQLLQRRLARGETVEAEHLERSLGYINAAVISMRDLIQELLDASLEQAGHSPALLLAPIDLVALTRQAVGEHQLAFGLHHFVFVPEPPTLLATVDGARIQRVLGNLLSNAVKYSPDGGTIRVAITEKPASDGAAAEIEVRDEGLGIPSADLGRIFDRFHRGANVAKRIPGTGVGLWSVRKIVEMHGGSISAESQEGSGSIFTVRLPRAPHATDATSEPVRAQPARAVPGRS